MALINLETYYAFPNIDSSNNIFRYSRRFVEVGRGDRDDGEDASQQRPWVDIRIPEGSYDVIDIAETIKIGMKRNGHGDVVVKISANTNTLKSVMEIHGDFQVDFRARNSISSVLGFRNQVYKEGIHESQNVVNIQGRTQGGVGVKTPLELDILQKLYYLRKEIKCFRILFACQFVDLMQIPRNKFAC